MYVYVHIHQFMYSVCIIFTWVIMFYTPRRSLKQALGAASEVLLSFLHSLLTEALV